MRLTRAAVVAASIELVDRDGLDALSLSAVAEVLGVRPSALYTHVAGSDHLHQAVATESALGLAREIRGVAVGIAGAGAIREVAETYRQFAQTYPGRYSSMVAPPLSAEPEFTAAMAEIEGVLLAVLAPAGSGLGSDESGSLATRVLSLLHGYVAFETASAHTVDADHFDALVASVVEWAARPG